MSSNPLEVIDVSLEDAATASQLVQAASSQGFLFVKGHGFNAEEVAALFDVSKQFFAQEREQKDKLAMDKSNFGYQYGVESLALNATPDPKETLNMDPLNIPDIEGKHKLESAVTKLQDLAMTIHRAFAVGLEIDESAGGAAYFDSKYAKDKPLGLVFRFLHYPGQQLLNPSEQIRAGAHTDYGSITLLFQQKNQEGLEIYSPVSKKWQAVPFIDADNDDEAPPIIVNVGDQLSYWTAGYLRLTIHRVKFPESVQRTGQDRYSIVYFCHPDDDTLLEPIPSRVIEARGNTRGANSAKETLTAKQHLLNRLSATYGWQY